MSEVVVSPGNAGTAAAPSSSDKVLRNLAGAPLEIARAEKVDLVVVGPEAPLCDGLVDDLSATRILAFGPSKAAARLEGSKAFMKDFVARHALPTAKHVTLTAVSEVAAAVRGFDVPPVVKASGLCAGKGVVVAESHAEAIVTAEKMLSGAAFGDAGRIVLVHHGDGANQDTHRVVEHGAREDGLVAFGVFANWLAGRCQAATGGDEHWIVGPTATLNRRPPRPDLLCDSQA